MPTTVTELFHNGGLTVDDVVAWGTPLPVRVPGVYAIATSPASDTLQNLHERCPVSPAAVGQLLAACPDIAVDGQPATADSLTTRLNACWLPDETVVYIGLAGTSLRRRVGDYYETPLGARRPHSGGWPLKTLAIRDQLWVFYAACSEVDPAERAMADAFKDGTSFVARSSLHDPAVPLPFANLQVPRGPRKRHGISGARGPA